MKPATNPARAPRAFTIIELLTVMSIIVILIGLLVPALNRVRQYATGVRQQAQLHSIASALELFRNEYGDYPDSGALDPDGAAYGGAMKLAEAIMGQDLLGFHPNSAFRRNGLDGAGNLQLYPPNPSAANLSARKGPYLQAENANAYRLESIYGNDVGPFLSSSFVLCDVFERNMTSGQKTGMPILYYKANTANNLHDPNVASAMTATDSRGNIYNYHDNQALVALGKPWEVASAQTPHGLADPLRFYRNTRSEKIITTARPYRPDSYLLISAGPDGQYGTADDICNYDWRYRE